MFKILDEICTPTKGSEFSACIDLYARKDTVIVSGKNTLVPLGIKIDKSAVIRLVGDTVNNSPLNFNDMLESFLRSHQLNLHIRSSMSAKHCLIIANGTGIIDLDYEGEIMICLHNPLSKMNDFQPDGRLIGFANDTFGYHIKKGDKIAQISLVEHKSYLFGVESKEKRDGGFGSTD